MNTNSLPVKKSYIIIGVIAVVLIIATMSLYGTFNSVQKGSVQRESRLSAQYLDNQNELSTYIVKVKEQLQIANLKTDKLDKVLSDAIQGRYGEASSAKPFGQGNAMFSAMVEAYPQLGNLDIYDKIADTISAGREAFKNKQSALLDQLREYDTWRNSGIVHSWLTGLAGVPSSHLVARIGNQSVTGAAAERQMYQIVTTADASQAFKSGEQAPLDLNPVPTTAPPPVR